MNNFRYSIPTTIYFGRDQLGHLTELKESGSRVNGFVFTEQA